MIKYWLVKCAFVGDHCEYCLDGFWGQPTGGANCSSEFSGSVILQIGQCAFFTNRSVQLQLNPLTAALRGSGYKFFVTLYHEPAVRLEHYLQNGTDSRRPGQNDTCKLRPLAGCPDLHIGPLFKNRKQNIICYDIYGCTTNRIYNKNSTICISRFFGGGQGRREINFRM